MMRRVLVVSVLVVLVAALVVVLDDAEVLEKTSRRAARAPSTETHGVTELAAVVRAEIARVASDEAVPDLPASTAAPAPAPQRRGVLVTLDDVPVPGAAVELWSGNEVLGFVTDDEGFVAADYHALGERSWTIACGWNGCVPTYSTYLCDWQQFVTVELVRCELAHIEVVRSDGRVYGDPYTGTLTGVWRSGPGGLKVTPNRRGEFYGTSRGSRNRLPRATLRSLQLAGLRVEEFRPGFVWISHMEDGEEPVLLSGATGEADTNRVEWSLRAAPVATGGAFTRIDLEVLEDRVVGVLEVAFVEPYEGCLLDIERLELNLRLPGQYEERVARLVVLEDDWMYEEGAAPRLRFEVEPGEFDVHVDMDLYDGRWDREPKPIVIRANATSRFEYTLPPLGAVQLVGAPPTEYTAHPVFVRLDGDRGPQSRAVKFHPPRTRAGGLAPGRYVAYVEDDDEWPRAFLAPSSMTSEDLALHPWFAGHQVPPPWVRAKLEVDEDDDGRNDLAPEDPFVARIAFELEAGEIQTLHFVPWPRPFWEER